MAHDAVNARVAGLFRGPADERGDGREGGHPRHDAPRAGACQDVARAGGGAERPECIGFGGRAWFGYDAQNRLVGFTQGAVVVSYGSDAEGRRASRTEGGTTRHSLYALGQEIAEYAGTALVARHVPGPGLDEPLVTVTGAPGSRARVWYHADAQGSVIARSDGSGAVPAGERFSYTPYGVAGSGSGSAVAFRFVGRRLEPAVGLYDMRARVYAPALGRFLQPDPIGTDGGINLYAYVRNDPLNLIDPSGMVIDQIGSAAWSLVRSGALIPGGQASVQAYAEFEQGNYASAALHAALGLGEVALTVATVGQGFVAIQAARPAISFAGSLARATSIEVRSGRIARSLEEIGGGIPRLATTPEVPLSLYSRMVPFSALISSLGSFCEIKDLISI
jgi:RHS repeat-associated protein